MRITTVLTALIAAPLLAVVACSPTHHQAPVKGTVAEKEYEPAKHCPKQSRHKGKKTTFKKSCTAHRECYELDIRTSVTGEETEVCDKAAYYLLVPGDPYNSAVDYSKKVPR